MPTLTLCERCDAPLDERMNWCSRCFFTAPWGPTSMETHLADISEWPNIWDGPPNRQIPRDWRDPDWEPAPQAASARQIVLWPLRKVVATVAMLLTGATLTAVFIPEQVVGLAAMATFGTMALFVVRQAWPGEPHSS